MLSTKCISQNKFSGCIKYAPGLDAFSGQDNAIYTAHGALTIAGNKLCTPTRNDFSGTQRRLGKMACCSALHCGKHSWSVLQTVPAKAIQQLYRCAPRDAPLGNRSDMTSPGARKHAVGADRKVSCAYQAPSWRSPVINCMRRHKTFPTPLIPEETGQKSELWSPLSRKKIEEMLECTTDLNHQTVPAPLPFNTLSSIPWVTAWINSDKKCNNGCHSSAR